MSQTLTVTTATRLHGEVNVPSDKSISHRAAMFGALAEGETRIENFLQGQDCQATLNCLRTLGIDVEQDGQGTVLVRGRGLYGLNAPQHVLDCAGSGTTMRLLSGLLAGQPFESVLSGNDSLRQRPMQRIIEPLRRMGVDIQGEATGLPPLRIRGGHVHGMAYHLPVASAQVKSAILLAGLYARQPTLVHEPAPARDHTERMLSAMGAKIEVTEEPIVLRSLASDWPLKPLEIKVPGDFSSAAFPLVGALLTPESRVHILDVGINPTRTGLLDVLRDMGARIEIENRRVIGGEPIANLIVETSSLVSTEVGGQIVPRMIDEFPILAVAATQAEGTTLIRDAAELRVKETDRIANTVAELERLGARIEERPDGFIVHGPTLLHGATVSAHGDHRLGMSLAIAGLVAKGETNVQGAESIDDSFPGFANLLVELVGERTA